MVCVDETFTLTEIIVYIFFFLQNSLMKNAIIDPSLRWPEANIPYVISASFRKYKTLSSKQYFLCASTEIQIKLRRVFVTEQNLRGVSVVYLGDN